jgi:hypothetical protein
LVRPLRAAGDFRELLPFLLPFLLADGATVSARKCVIGVQELLADM